MKHVFETPLCKGYFNSPDQESQTSNAKFVSDSNHQNLSFDLLEESRENSLAKMQETSKKILKLLQKKVE